MGDNRLLSALVSLSEKMRPVLVKLVPRSLLRKAKRSVVRQAAAEGIGQAKPAPFERGAFPDGVNLIGPVRSETGLGQSCRLVADGLKATGLPLQVLEYNPISAAEAGAEDWDGPAGECAVYNVNLIHINPHELPIAYLQLDKNTWDKRYNIMFWLWELERFPEQWLPTLALADEIWTPSDFASIGLRAVTSKPCRTMPYAISAPVEPGVGRADFGLPEGDFLFLAMYASGSVAERKNPLGAIEAYRQAFGADETGVGLVLKAGSATREELAELRRHTEGLSHVYVLTDTLPKPRLNALIAAVDAYVSLHRAEGFGLVPAEAMLLGTPVVATNWSANAEFMDETVACMVDCQLITLERDYGPFEKGNRWADPDIAQAAGFMRRLREDPAFAADLARRAKAHIGEKLSLESAAGRMRARLEEIYGEAGKTGHS